MRMGRVYSRPLCEKFCSCTHCSGLIESHFTRVVMGQQVAYTSTDPMFHLKTT